MLSIVFFTRRILSHELTIAVVESSRIFVSTRHLLVADVATALEIRALPDCFCDELFEVGLARFAHHLAFISRDGWDEIELATLMVVLEPS